MASASVCGEPTAIRWEAADAEEAGDLFQRPFAVGIEFGEAFRKGLDGVALEAFHGSLEVVVACPRFLIHSL